MNHGSLFSGIGGFDLASEWMGWNNVFHCEIDKFCQKILKYYWPNAISYGDIKTTDFTVWRGKFDILSAGFPCQPASLAGKRAGTEDDRWLWPETIRAIKEGQPTYIVLENVLGLTSILESACETEMEIKAVHLFSEGDNSNEVEQRISEVKKRAIGTIIEDIKQAGYILPETSTGESIILCVPACGVNAPHKRERIWIIAFNSKRKSNGRDYAGESSGIRMEMERDKLDKAGRNKSADSIKSSGTNGIAANSGSKYSTLSIQQRGQNQAEDINAPGEDEGGVITNTTITGRKEREQDYGRENTEKNKTRMDDRPERFGEFGNAAYPERQGHKRPATERATSERGRIMQPTGFERFPTVSPVCQRNDGISGRLSGITFPKWRNESIKSMGNAIVPQVAYQIFKVINEITPK